MLCNLSQIANLGLVCVCNSEHVYFALEGRIKSRLNALRVTFPEYSLDDLVTILTERALLPVHDTGCLPFQPPRLTPPVWAAVSTKRSFPQDAADNDLQLTAYALAYRTLYGHDEGGLRLDVMVRNKQPKTQQLEATRTQADIDRFLRLAEQVARAIKGEVYYPNENFMCGVCGYDEMCGEW